MCDARNDTIEPEDVFWAFDRDTGKRADHTGPCVCTEVSDWTVYAVDLSDCERVFLRYKFRFELIEGQDNG